MKCFNCSRVDGLQCCSPFFFPPWCLNAARCGVLRRAIFAPPWCFPVAHFVTYTYYSILHILEFLQPLPLLAARYRLYSRLQRLGNCKQMQIIPIINIYNYIQTLKTNVSDNFLIEKFGYIKCM